MSYLLLPQLSPAFIMGIKQHELFHNWKGSWGDVDVSIGNTTITTPYQLYNAFDNSKAQKGDVGIIINLAAGVQIGSAVYYF